MRSLYGASDENDVRQYTITMRRINAGESYTHKSVYETGIGARD